MVFKRRKSQSAKSKKEDFSIRVFTSLEKNIENIQKLLDSPNDLTIRRFALGNTMNSCSVIFIDGLVNKKLIHDKIIQNIQLEIGQQPDDSTESKADLFEVISKKVVSVSDVKKATTLDDVSLAILSGDTVFFLDGLAQALIIGSKSWESRSIEEPITEALIRGPRDGFTENLRTNTVLIRRKIRDPNLRFKEYKIGRRSKKSLIVAYIDGIVNQDIVKEVKRRLDTIDMDDAPESGYVEQWIEDSFLSPFPQIQNTERPDKVTSALLQGKVAIVLDGTPFVLIAPITFGNTLQSPEDYYERWMVGTVIRLLRYLAAFIAVFLPSLYIALVSYHPGMIPSKLAFSIAATREGVPFPAFIEALLMAITMELLREAGIRLPKPIGQTIGIVGGLVIGEAAVSAGIVSPIMVIVVAVTAIASFSIPSYSVAISFRIIRFGFMFAAAIFGLYGIILCYIMLNIHIANLKSIGVPYSTLFAPSFNGDWKDLILRAPITMLPKRPRYMQTEDERRIEKGGSST
ncbi:spore germination protein [Alkalihalobacillus sp. AL-G]|uniref:spore germination protein n=1 Tax=Alkalihalobacillus sp. AL-G TaxID=2926399 RepID=UPI00272CD3B8|nr:spore germination protein [Alkalihalobacillus sp. AL-G]WLD92750.1 spore germination protein [Alkalihalobacillus sp. AL-G]